MENMMMQPQQEQAPAQNGVSPEDRAKLGRLIETANNKRASNNAMVFAGKNQAESMRQDALMEVFQSMQKSGIDPSNPEQVKAFLDQLEQQNPQLYQDFVQAFEMLMGSQAQPGIGAQEPEEEMMEGQQMPAMPQMQQQSGPAALMPGLASGGPGKITNKYPGLSGKKK